MLYHCKICGKEGKCKSSENRKYCSRECFIKAGEIKRTYSCTQCSIIFQIPKEGKPKRGKPFCSSACFNLYQTGKNNVSWKGIKESRKCQDCGSDFWIKTTQRKGVANFCSIKCRTNYYLKQGHPRSIDIFDQCGYCKKKIKLRRKANIGKRNFCDRNCANNAHSFYIGGENNGRYLHGQHMRGYPAGWTKTYKDIIRQRDNFKCIKCGLSEADHKIRLHVHHIDYNKDNLSMENLITLCKYCHGGMHGSNESRDRWKEKLSNLLKEQELYRDMSTI